MHNCLNTAQSPCSSELGFVSAFRFLVRGLQITGTPGQTPGETAFGCREIPSKVLAAGTGTLL